MERASTNVANIKSQIKRNRQNEAARQRNKAVRSELKTRIKRAEEAMRGERMSDEEQATTKAALMRSLALVKVKRRRQV